MEDRETKDLERALEQIWEIARRFGLDPFPTRFEIVPATVMYEIGSYALPGRYSHWSFGKAYHRMKTMYDFGLSKIYEVVINTNPSYGFLMETNSPVQNKLVIAHVLGHTDFFKNNVYFSKTNRRMVESVSTHAGRMNEYEFRYGRKTVEKFLDSVLSIEEHIDPNFFIRRARPAETAAERERQRDAVPAAPEGRYDDLWKIGEPPREPEAATADDAASAGQRRLPLPEKDLVYFILKNSPTLADWQRDAMAMIHEEMEYFVPQMQTKIMNEGWACARGDSLVLTEDGFVPFARLYEDGRLIRVAGGKGNQIYQVTDFHAEEKVPTIRIRTRRGLMLEGSLKHRVLTAGGCWSYLEDLNLGDRVAVEVGSNVWPQDKQPLTYIPAARYVARHQVAALAGVSTATVNRHLKGVMTQRSPEIESALEATSYSIKRAGWVSGTRAPLRTSGVLDEDLAWVLGFFIGDGCKTKSGICLTCGDAEYAERMSAKITDSLGLRPSVRWDATEVGGRWRIEVHSRELISLLESLGIDLRDRARSKKIPPQILRSPKVVVSGFLRGYFDADAYAGKEGIRLSSSSEELIRTVQVVLLNYGILSTQRQHPHDIRQLEITGASAALFLEEIGFGLERKQQALRDYVESHHWFKKEDCSDEIVSIERGCADVYDITVDEAHAYVADGFVNHNSFWHARIMRELDLPDVEMLEFAELHSGVVSPHKGQLNPYYLGYKIFEDIERRWDEPAAGGREKPGRGPGGGREKIFEVRELDNDVSFLRNYLTEELCEELDLFVYELVEDEEWTVTEKSWERVRDQLVANMTNFGFPYIVVADGDYNGNRELYLKHQYEGAELDGSYARKVLEHVHALWGRPVHLETVADGEPLVMRYDGEEHTDED